MTINPLTAEELEALQAGLPNGQVFVDDPDWTVTRARRLLSDYKRLRAENESLCYELNIARSERDANAAAVGDLERLLITHRAVVAERDRLKEGDFTETEFQNLCHNMKVDGHHLTYEDVERFQRGCDDYQRKLFGELCGGNTDKG